jgi:cytochrome c peroxidase
MKIRYLYSLLFVMTILARPAVATTAFTPAVAGSYTLPVIAKAGDGKVLTSDNQPESLSKLMAGKLVLLSFIYTTCSDASGCPLATQVLHKISRRLQGQPDVLSRVRMLTLSFNPLQDTPQVMHDYAASVDKGNLDWLFLTTASTQELQPILDAYQQPVQKNTGQAGGYAHLLRVYLIDSQQRIRNIYSIDFLQADVIINDIKTLLQTDSPKSATPPLSGPRLYQPGDDKQHYQQADYQTRSLALLQRRGQPANLLQDAMSPPLGLPRLPIPADNQLTPQKIVLGRKLFYDRRLSLNNTFSCATCHIPEQGFTSNEMATAIGVEGRTVRRNTPSLYNVGYAQLLFHDGRENSLEQQVWGPLLAHNEMANPSIGFVVDKINTITDYAVLFEQAFHKKPGMETIAQALASYERTLNSADSAFDRWYFGGQGNALSDHGKLGYGLFIGKAGCSNCHRIEAKQALFTDQLRHNTGIGYREAMQPTPEKQHVQLAPGVFVDVDSQQLKAVSELKANDLGYYEITQNPDDRWRYKTPVLRNVALTAPYMHNGSLATLEEVVRFYNQGGVANENLSPLMHPLQLSKSEIAALVAFLQSLTGSNVEKLVADAFAAPVGERQ